MEWWYWEAGPLAGAEVLRMALINGMRGPRELVCPSCHVRTLAVCEPEEGLPQNHRSTIILDFQPPDPQEVNGSCL